MARTRLRWASWVLAALFLAPQSFAFDTPLSDTAVREAYFLGQRHDEAVAKFLDQYVRHLSPPKSGPYVSSVALYTPYSQLVSDISQRIGNYSAQQALIDHRGRQETVLCIIQIQLTETYPALIPDPARSSSASSIHFIPRPYDFWSDFQFHFREGEDELRPLTTSGHPNYSCGRHGECILTGATVQLEFLASEFPTNEVQVEIDPPEGDQRTLGFELASVR